MEFDQTITDQDVTDVIASFKTDNSAKSVELFKQKMPMAVSDKSLREKVLKSLPEKIYDLQIKDAELEKKIRLLIKPVLTLYSREKTFELIIFKHSVPFVALDSGVVILISTGFLTEVEHDDEVLGAVAHEIGHEFFGEYSLNVKFLLRTIQDRKIKQTALVRKFENVLGIIELECDAFLSITLTHLGYDPIAFTDFIGKMDNKHRREEKGVHPAVGIRKLVIEGVLPKASINKNDRKSSPLLLEIKHRLNFQ